MVDHEITSGSGEGSERLKRPEIVRTLSIVQTEYDFQRYLSPDTDPGLNLPTALAAMHAINAKGQEKGWTDQDLRLTLPVTRVALTTAGFAHAENGLHALLTGSTGQLQEIVNKVLPQDASKGIQWVAKTTVWANTFDNMRVVFGLLIDEKKLEQRLLRLTKLQQNILLNPGRTSALLALLNGEYVENGLPGRTGLPQEAETHLKKICPFSLEDMNAVNKLFTAVEWRMNSDMQIKAHHLNIQTELERLRAAGINVGRIVSQGSSTMIESLLLVTGGIAGGVLGGIALAVEEGGHQAQEAVEKIKRRQQNRGRKASAITVAS